MSGCIGKCRTCELNSRLIIEEVMSFENPHLEYLRNQLIFVRLLLTMAPQSIEYATKSSEGTNLTDSPEYIYIKVDLGFFFLGQH